MWYFMLTLRLDNQTDSQLVLLCEVTGKTKSDIVRDALKNYFKENEDYLKTIEALKCTKQTFTLDEAAKILGVNL